MEVHRPRPHQLLAGGQHIDPRVDPRPTAHGWTPLQAQAAESRAQRVFCDALRLDGGSTRAGVVDDLAEYYDLDQAQVVDRCINWERWSTDEWFSGSRDSIDEITDFYRSTESWSFDLLWYAYLQAEDYMYPVSAAIATTIAGIEPRPTRVLDFGCGVGVTAQMFQRLGYDTCGADIATGILSFAKFRCERRGDDITFVDLNSEELPSGRFDIVTAIDTLVHIPNLERTLTTLHATLRPNGLLFANVAARPRTRENAAFLYDDDLPVRRLIHAVGFVPVASLDGMVIMYRRVDPTGLPHLARRTRDRVTYSSLRRTASKVAGAVRSRT